MLPSAFQFMGFTAVGSRNIFKLFSGVMLRLVWTFQPFQFSSGPNHFDQRCLLHSLYRFVFGCKPTSTTITGFALAVSVLLFKTQFWDVIRTLEEVTAVPLTAENHRGDMCRKTGKVSPHHVQE